MYRVDPPIIPRKRAFSECYDFIEGRADASPLVRTASDTDLDKFDRLKSFENAEAFRQTTGLLAKVVSALATIQPPPPHEDSSLGSAGMYGGYHGFSDSQIMSSEWSFPSVNAALPIQPKRGRACSDFNINPRWNVGRPAQNEWTWSGGDHSQIQQAINSRVKNGRNAANTDDNLYRGESFARAPPEYVVNMDDEELTARKSNVKKFSIPDSLRKLFPFKKRNSQMDFSEASGAAASNGNRKFSTISVPEVQLHQVPPLDYYSTVTANASATYFRDGRMRQPLSPIPQSRADSAAESFGRTQERHPSNSSLSSRLSAAAPNSVIAVRRESMYDAEQATLQSNASAYQRSVAAATRKRRESIFTQNPAINARRGSMFPSTNAAAALTQRRGSLFNAADRRGSNTTATALPPRRGSMFPTPTRSPLAPHERRPSVFSVANEEDRDVLENTTLADLIRALELMHTQAVMDEAAAVAAMPQSGRRPGGYKKRKTGNLGPDPPEFSPILSLFAGDKALTTAAANRLYARRSTIVGTMPSTMPPLVAAGTVPHMTTTNILTRRRPSTTQNTNDPPPSYSENDTSSAIATKFKRRFSVRPTALQIPPGKAPPPNDSFNNLLLQPPTSSMATLPSTATTSGVTSQTVLQRRLSLRPSPLAREVTTLPQVSAGTSNIGATAEGTSSNPLTSTGRPNVPSSATRLLPPAGVQRSAVTGSSSTHSPLSRIVQIAEAQRKSSAPDGFATDRNKKPDGSK